VESPEEVERSVPSRGGDTAQWHLGPGFHPEAGQKKVCPDPSGGWRHTWELWGSNVLEKALLGILTGKHLRADLPHFNHSWAAKEKGQAHTDKILSPS
jgi:hypothetical protein